MRRVHGKVNYRHFGFHDPDDEMYYHYDNDVYLLIYKESGEFDYGHSLRVEYVLKDRSKMERKAHKRTVGEDRQMIMKDIEKKSGNIYMDIR